MEEETQEEPLRYIIKWKGKDARYSFVEAIQFSLNSLAGHRNLRRRYSLKFVSYTSLGRIFHHYDSDSTIDLTGCPAVNSDKVYIYGNNAEKGKKAMDRLARDSGGFKLEEIVGK